MDQIRITMPEGPRDMEPGDRLSLPDRVGKRLLELAPGRVKVMASYLPFQINDRVRYTIPDPRSRSPHPAWQEHAGVILQVDPVGEMVLVVPETEPGTQWRWVAWVYVQGKQDEK